MSFSHKCILLFSLRARRFYIIWLGRFCIGGIVFNFNRLSSILCFFFTLSYKSRVILQHFCLFVCSFSTQISKYSVYPNSAAPTYVTASQVSINLPMKPLSNTRAILGKCREQFSAKVSSNISMQTLDWSWESILNNSPNFNSMLYFSLSQEAETGIWMKWSMNMVDMKSRL